MSSTTASTVSDASRDWIERLIAFDTTSRYSNLELIACLSDYLAELGVTATLVHNPEKTKANLYATLGPGDRGGIALSGHTDVVPVDGQDWSSDPFRVAERDGRLYGRGTCDMKSFIAVALAQAPRILAANPKIPVHYCFSFDEEIGCKGVPHLLDFLAHQPIRPALCIIGEPTSMQVITAHKGKLAMTCDVRGKEAHSSLAPHGVNAIDAAARLVTFIADLAAEKAQLGPFDHDYDVPHTTIQTGVISGGTQLNIVPGHCQFQFEFRNLPSDDPQALLARVQSHAQKDIEPAMKAIDPASGFSWTREAAYPGLHTDPDSDVVALAKSLSGSNSTGKVSFGTEGGLFHQAGMPTVICGPGSIDQAHKPDEYVSLEQLHLCEAFMDRLVEHIT
ncbi:MAG: acetylornithine deacetylase [Pseudomonadota bacterium]